MTGFSGSYTFRLFKTTNISPFFEGMASILDASNSDRFYNYDNSPAEADRNAIHSDWQQVGNDLRSAMREYASRQTA